MINNKLYKKARALLFLLLVIIVLSAFPLSIGGVENTIPCQSSSKAYAIYFCNIENSTVLFEKNSDKKISPASTVKLMTAMVAWDSIKDRGKTVTVSEQMIKGVGGNTMKLQVGENIRIDDLFWGMVCSGYNDAAVALAVISCGSVDKFIDKMNSKAAELGAVDTIYADPTGVDDSAQTTAYDTMLIAKAFMTYSDLYNISSSTSHEISKTNLSEARTLHNRNAMISNRSVSKYLNSNALGMNAGMTSGGGYCVVTSMNRDGMTYLCVVMGGSYNEDSDTVYSYTVANELLNYVAKNLGYRVVLSADNQITSLPVVGAEMKVEGVAVAAREDVRVYLPANYLESGDFKISYVYYKDELTAPVAIGETVGKVVVRYGEDIIAVTDIVTADDIPRNGFMYAMKVVRNFIFSRGTIASLLFFVILLVGYYTIKSRKRSSKRKHRNINTYKF